MDYFLLVVAGRNFYLLVKEKKLNSNIHLQSRNHTFSSSNNTNGSRDIEEVFQNISSPFLHFINPDQLERRGSGEI